MDKDTLLEVIDLKQYFPIRKGLMKRVVGNVRAVDGVSFEVRRGETLGLVGESGSGKTTAGRCIVRLYDPTSGSINFNRDEGVVDIASLDRRELRSVRRDIQMLFQDPNSSLNARMRIGDIVAEPLEIHDIGDRRSRAEQVERLQALTGGPNNRPVQPIGGRAVFAVPGSP